MNRLCRAGKVSAVIAAGVLPLARGKQLDDRDGIDLGPDENAVVFCMFRSPHTPAHLNWFLDMEFARPITKEGEVGNNNWIFMTGPRKTLVSRMVEEEERRRLDRVRS
jgi:hypothetical protein